MTSNPYGPPDSAEKMTTDSLESLDRIRVLSDTGRVSTDRMQERWAKQFLNGDYEKRMREVLMLADPKQKEKGENKSGLAS